MFPTTNRPSVVGETCYCASSYWGRDPSSPSLTYESKESFDRAFEELCAPPARLALDSTFPVQVLQGVPHRPPQAKGQEESAPEGTAQKTCWHWAHSLDLQGQRVPEGLKHSQGSCWAAQHPQGSTSQQSRCTWFSCKQGI